LLAVCIKYRFADRSQAGETGYLFSIGRRSAARSDVNGIEPAQRYYRPAGIGVAAARKLRQLKLSLPRYLRRPPVD
jgi:hypothetical protein